MAMLPVVHIPMGTPMDVQDHPERVHPRRTQATYRSLDPSRALDIPTPTDPIG